MTAQPDPAKLPEIKEFLHTWGISATALAEGIGLSNKTVSNKFSPNFRDSFSPEQQADVLSYLAGLHEALSKLLKQHQPQG